MLGYEPQHQTFRNPHLKAAVCFSCPRLESSLARRAASIIVTKHSSEFGLAESSVVSRTSLGGGSETNSLQRVTLLPGSAQHGSECAEQNSGILAEGTNNIILAIKLNTFSVIRGVPTGHLPQPCDAGAQ